MPLPSKQNELYRRILRDLRENYFPGALLPSEPRYADLLGCGRTTLRKVLATLQEEKKIRRTHSGTFVLDEATGTCPQLRSDANPVYLLLPCANYTDAIDPCSLTITREFIAGAMRGTIECGRQLVTLPVSETNRDGQGECLDVAWSQTAILKKADTVLFLGRWYRRLIPFLDRTGCRVGYISQLPEAFPVRNSPPSVFTGYTGFSTTAFILPALKLIRDGNRGKTGCFWFYIEEKERETVEKCFYRHLELHGAHGKILSVPFHVSPERKKQLLEQFQAENHFDSLIVCPHLSPEPWPETPLKGRKGQLLISSPGGPVCEPGGERILGHDHLFAAARNLVVSLLRSEAPREPVPYPYEFVSRPEQTI